MSCSFCPSHCCRRRRQGLKQGVCQSKESFKQKLYLLCMILFFYLPIFQRLKAPPMIVNCIPFLKLSSRPPDIMSLSLFDLFISYRDREITLLNGSEFQSLTFYTRPLASHSLSLSHPRTRSSRLLAGFKTSPLCVNFYLRSFIIHTSHYNCTTTTCKLNLDDTKVYCLRGLVQY